MVEAYIPAVAITFAKRVAACKESSITAPLNSDPLTATEAHPPVEVEVTIALTKVRTCAMIAIDPYVEPRPVTHDVSEDFPHISPSLESSSPTEDIRDASGVVTPHRSSTHASPVEQIEVTPVKSEPSA